MKQMKRTLKRWLGLTVVLAVISVQPTMAQQTGGIQILSPEGTLGIGFNADTNHPIFSGSLTARMDIGQPTDVLGLAIGFGYRGYFDRRPPYEFIRNSTASDYLFYSDENGHSKNVRPVGGMWVIPVEMQLRFLSLGKETRLFAGCGAEYSFRCYQSNRYANYYGKYDHSHMLNKSSLSVYPMLGICGGDDDIIYSISLYWRHYTKSVFNYQDMWDPDKFDARNYFGFQISLSFEI